MAAELAMTMAASELVMASPAMSGTLEVSVAYMTSGVGRACSRLQLARWVALTQPDSSSETYGQGRRQR